MKQLNAWQLSVCAVEQGSSTRESISTNGGCKGRTAPARRTTTAAVEVWRHCNGSGSTAQGRYPVCVAAERSPQCRIGSQASTPSKHTPWGPSKALHTVGLDQGVGLGQVLPPGGLVVKVAGVRLSQAVGPAKNKPAPALEARQPHLNTPRQHDEGTTFQSSLRQGFIVRLLHGRCAELTRCDRCPL